MYNPSKVMNGTWGECWIDSLRLAEITSLNATASAKTEAISQCGELVDGQKIVGLECKGTIKVNKINSYFLKLIGDDLKKGLQTEFTIISKIKDPANGKTERVKLMGCTFSELTLVNWELKKNLEESMPFNFTSWKVMDYAN